jgi:hypothetical protein
MPAVLCVCTLVLLYTSVMSGEDWSAVKIISTVANSAGKKLAEKPPTWVQELLHLSNSPTYRAAVTEIVTQR